MTARQEFSLAFGVKFGPSERDWIDFREIRDRLMDRFPGATVNTRFPPDLRKVLEYFS